MADFFDALDERHVAMIAAQPVFFVATAAEGARINLSPKGYDCLRVLSPKRVAWLDLGGSGNETNAHLLADGRITLMFCNFRSRPRSCGSTAAANRSSRGTAAGTSSPRISRCCPARGRSSTSRSRACRPAAAGAFR
jgi:hypothetical protein